MKFHYLELSKVLSLILIVHTMRSRGLTLELLRFLSEVTIHSYAGIPIYSKKSTTLFPQPKLLAERVAKFLDDFENNKDVTVWAKKKETKYVPPK